MSHKQHLKLRFFSAAIRNSSLHNLKSDLSNFSYKVKGVLKNSPNKLHQYVTNNFKAGCLCIYHLQRNVT